MHTDLNLADVHISDTGGKANKQQKHYRSNLALVDDLLCELSAIRHNFLKV